jgi:hypothetical protein
MYHRYLTALCHGIIGYHMGCSHWLMGSLGISLENSLSVGRMLKREVKERVV